MAPKQPISVQSVAPDYHLYALMDTCVSEQGHHLVPLQTIAAMHILLVKVLGISPNQKYDHHVDITYCWDEYLSAHCFSFYRSVRVSIALLTNKLCADHNTAIDDRYILTLPAEWRMYKSQRSITQIRYANYRLAFEHTNCSPTSSTVCTLFILIRYSSILILFISLYFPLSPTNDLITCRHHDR